MKDFKEKNDDQYDLEPSDDPIATEEELEDIETDSEQKIKDIKKKLKECEKEKMGYLEDLQRAKAEFLNGKRRLEEERSRDRERAVAQQVEKLLPMCDSFHLAMSDTHAWEAIDETWRKGIESIYNQLQSILASYNVAEFSPLGEEFDPERQEAVANVVVTDKKAHHKIIAVIQNGFVRSIHGKEELIRPARVTVGEYQEEH